MFSNYIDAISNIQLFNGILIEELTTLFSLPKYEIKTYEKDQIIHLQNEVCNNLDLIIEGQVAVQNISENGNILTIYKFKSRDFIGANILFSKINQYPMTVVATSRTTILHIKKELVLQLCKTSDDFMVGFMGLISDRTIILTDKINAISLKTIRESIMDFLKFEYHIQKTNVIVLGISKKDLAERLGIQRSSLSRELNKMRKDGLVEFDTKTITLKKV